MIKKVLVLFLICVTWSLFAENKRIYIDDVFVTLDAAGEIENFESDVDAFKADFKNTLLKSFEEITTLNNLYILATDHQSANIVIEPKVEREGDNLKIFLFKKDTTNKLLGKEKFFLIDPYDDEDNVRADIENNAKSVLLETFGIYWLLMTKGKETGVSGIVIKEIKKQLTNELLKTKKALIFSKEKNRIIAEQLEEEECIEAECLQDIAPFMTILTVDIEKAENNILLGLDISRAGTTFRSKKVVFTKDEFEKSFNEGKSLDRITDIAFDLMDVFNIDYLNEKLSEVKAVINENGDFDLAKTKIDDLQKKFYKDEFLPVLNEYTTFINNAQQTMLQVKKQNPLPVFPAVFGTLAAGGAVVGGVFTYLYFDERTKKDIALSNYNDSTFTSETVEYREEYLTALENQNRNMIIFISSYSAAGACLITGIIGLSVQLATISNTKKKLIHESNTLQFMQKVSFDFGVTPEDEMLLAMRIKF